MNETTLDGVTYPVLTQCDTTKLKQLVTQGGFSEELTYKQHTTLRHLEEGKVLCVEVTEDSPLFSTPTFMFMTPQQHEVWWRTKQNL